MRYSILIIGLFTLAVLFTAGGCDSLSKVSRKQITTPKKLSPNSPYRWFEPKQVKILPLSCFQKAENGSVGVEIVLYVSLLDGFDCPIKAPAVFRFEAYERVPRSPTLKGERVTIWPDIDLTMASLNNKYWKKFLRAYKFQLDFEPEANKDYVLQVTAFYPQGKLLTDNIILSSGK